MKRRIISLLMAALLLLPISAAVAAGTPVTITSEDVRGSVGDTVTVAINMVVEPPKLGQIMDSIQFVLEYDSAALEFVEIQGLSQDRLKIMGVEYLCNVTTKSGAVAFTAASSGGVSGSGTMMNVRFRIKSAVSTMLVLKKVSYSFITPSSGVQKSYTGGIVNLGRVTGQSVPNTIAPYTSAPVNSQPPTAVATDEPRFPVTEITQAPGSSPVPEPNEGDSDMLAYIVFGLFIVVAILICVVLTLMIVRRGRNKANIKYFEDDEEDEEPLAPEEEEPYEEAPEEEPPEEDEEEDEPPIEIVRRVPKE